MSIFRANDIVQWDIDFVNKISTFKINGIQYLQKTGVGQKITPIILLRYGQVSFIDFNCVKR
eukprot:UN11627